MTHEYRLLPKAIDGLERLADRIKERFGDRVAERILDRLQRAVEHLASMPESGHRRPEFTVDLMIRFWSVGPTLIAYRIEGDRIDVLFIERGELDWPRLFEQEEQEPRGWRPVPAGSSE